MKTKPPTTEAMCKIVAIKEEWSDGCTYNSLSSRPFVENDSTQYADKERSKDPRTDIDAADELLHWLCETYTLQEVRCTGGLMVWTDLDSHITIPISGTAKCTMICNLAAKILEVE